MKNTSNIGVNILIPLDPMGKRTISKNIDAFGIFHRTFWSGKATFKSNCPKVLGFFWLIRGSKNLFLAILRVCDLFWMVRTHVTRNRWRIDSWRDLQRFLGRSRGDFFEIFITCFGDFFVLHCFLGMEKYVFPCLKVFEEKIHPKSGWNLFSSVSFVPSNPEHPGLGRLCMPTLIPSK